jgi:hypothetical protein
MSSLGPHLAQDGVVDAVLVDEPEQRAPAA